MMGLMTEERRKQLYAEAREISETRQNYLKREKYRKLELAGIERQLKRKEEKEKAKKIKQFDKERWMRKKRVARDLLQFYKKWKKQLERSLEEHGNELEEHIIKSRTFFINRLEEMIFETTLYLQHQRYRTTKD